MGWLSLGKLKVTPPYIILFLAMLLTSVTSSHAQQAGGLGPKDLALRGDAVCTKCHDEGEAYPVLAIGRTKHGTVADARTPTCTSCHGESPTHVSKPEGVTKRPLPDRTFGKKTTTPAETRNAACMNCHEGSARMFWAGSTHQSRDVACTNCHQIHTDHDKVREKPTQAEACFNCHKQQRGQVSKPSHHPIEEGKVTCSDCHNPHGSAGPSLMVRDTVNDTCFQCHTEKRGPFLWNHQPVTENCAYCHNPHGTTVAGMLKWRPPYLCQQCHEPTSHRGNLPGIDLGSSTSNSAGIGITMGKACLNCHVQIHGSNNPSSATSTSSRALRR